jgi:hypothetical protein
MMGKRASLKSSKDSADLLINFFLSGTDETKDFGVPALKKNESKRKLVEVD